MLQLTRETVFNRKVCISSFPENRKKSTKPGLTYLKKHWSHLQELELKSLSTPGSRSILLSAHTEATFGTLQLEKLTLSYCSLDNEVFEELAYAMILPDLKILDLDYPDYDPHFLTRLLMNR